MSDKLMFYENRNLYAEIARAYLKYNKVYHYRLKKISDMSDDEVIQKCHWWYEENNLGEDYRIFQKNYFNQEYKNVVKGDIMKLKDGIVTNSIDGESFAIATGKAAKNFNGLIKNNPTAAFIFELLKKEQTIDSIVSAMMQKYAVDEATVRADVEELINILKSKDLIED
ncbi:MAG: PqqD family protein [Eubacterium sp.]|nr:PqqD family protein [Eubacterium sp.]